MMLPELPAFGQAGESAAVCCRHSTGDSLFRTSNLLFLDFVITVKCIELSRDVLMDALIRIVAGVQMAWQRNLLIVEFAN